MNYIINSDLFVGIFSSIVAYLLIQIVIYTKTKWKTDRSPLTGKWLQTIIDNSGQVRTKDLVFCKQIGTKVKANIRRTEPINENHKEWDFEGEFRKDLLFGIFWSKTDNNFSNGTIQMLEKIEHDQIQFEGFYTKAITKNNLKQKRLNIEKKIDENRIIWKKI